VRPHGGEVRFRVGGEMASGGDVTRPAAEVWPSIVKRLAGLNPTETRKPQEGRLMAVVNSRTYELRIKTAGTVHGEQVAVRIIDVATSQMRLEDLGLQPNHIAALRDALTVRHGLVVLSSPKDSGLTTSLHACLRTFDRYVNNVVAFEPRVEIEVENVQHVVINQDDGPTAAAEVRSQVRLEPDIITFDSLYLPEAAQVLAEALQEHTVVIGVRAADTSEALGKLTTLFGSVAPLATHLQLIVNQRIVRCLCPECREAYRPNPEFLRKANLAGGDVNVLYRPRSRAEVDKQGKPIVCLTCHNERYIGRTGLFEVMSIDAEARDMIARNSSVQDLRIYARKQGMMNLQEEGLQLVTEGRTSIEEVQRAMKQTS
jgi:general secretion pathway protein E